MSDDKIKEFPKPKKVTPEDYFLPVYHECIDGHMSMKWMLQVHDSTVIAVCTDCSDWYKIDDLITKVMEDYNGEG